MPKELVVTVDADTYEYFTDVAKQEAGRKQATGDPGFPLDHPALRLAWQIWKSIEAQTDYEKLVIVPASG